MVVNNFGQGTQVGTSPQIQFQQDQETAAKKTSPEEKCRINGGTWDAQTQTCLYLNGKKDPNKINIPSTDSSNPPLVDATGIETFTNSKTGRAGGVTLPDGRTFLGLSPEDVQTVATGEQEREARPLGTNAVGTAQSQSNASFRGEQLTGQVGQFDELGTSPTGLDTGEALTTATINSIPSAIRMAGQFGTAGAVLGATAAPVTGGLSIAAGAAIGAGVGFVSGIASGMIGSYKSQRTDTTTAQQRVLDEGKQNLNDWATLAASDPANKEKYLSEYNRQAALIDQAYRQMKLDTSRDLGKFETALPNLAEFETYYSFGGEKAALDLKMRMSLASQSPPNYNMLELGYRRRE